MNNNNMNKAMHITSKQQHKDPSTAPEKKQQLRKVTFRKKVNNLLKQYITIDQLGEQFVWVLGLWFLKADKIEQCVCFAKSCSSSEELTTDEMEGTA